MITPPQEKSCDFIAVSGGTLLACPQPQKLGCCRMWGKPKLYQMCLLIRNFTSCIFFPSHIRAEVCFKMAFVVMRVRTGCTQFRKPFQLQLPAGCPRQQQRESNSPARVLTPLGSLLQRWEGSAATCASSQAQHASFTAYPERIWQSFPLPSSKVSLKHHATY